MRKRSISAEKLDHIIKLKQAGASWLKIQGETGIPRRSAKRAHEEWEHSKSSEELKIARTNVAAEEFRDHMNSLVALALSLLNSFYTPTPLTEMGNVDQVLQDFWRRDIHPERTRALSEEEERRIIRQNKMLFASLQQHTREKVRWQALEEWKEAFTVYMQHCMILRTEARKVVGDVLNQRPQLEVRIGTKGTGQKIIEDMAKGVVESVWRGILAGQIEDAHASIGTKLLLNNDTAVSFAKDAANVLLQFPDAKLAAEVADVCKSAVMTLCQGKKSHLIQDMKDDMDTMEKRVRELEEMLDELVLRPLILRTKCELCPA